MTRFRSSLLPALLFLCCCATAIADQNDPDETEVRGATVGRAGDPVAVDPEHFDFSEAENRLWMDDHLANIQKPARLYYSFVKKGSYEDGFTDAVYLDILHVNDDGSKDTNMQFFTGDREQPFGADNVTHVRGNPVIGTYMRGDVFEMNRLTSGSWRYFQRAIKLAFADGAEVQPVKIKFDGKDVDGEKITITPFVKDPHRKQFEKFADKRYEFIVSNDVPGMLYQINTIIPTTDPGKDSEPLIQETLTLERVEATK